jgi:alpha-L-arabinofuranosidase
VPIVDEHYYEAPAWFLSNQHRYDHYNRNLSGVYIGEYASRGNTLGNALAEAVYMTSLERNADVVRMASYAPLLANQQHTSWNPNLIYFTNTRILPTVNYYVQQLFSRNQGDLYYDGLVSFAQKDSVLAASCVKDTHTGDLIIKIVNAGPAQTVADIQLGSLMAKNASAEVQVLSGEPGMKNTWEHPETIVPKMAAIQPGRKMQYDVIPYSLTVIRVKK